jgi:hypothetical protein
MYKKGVQMKQSIEEKIEKRAREIIANPGHREPPSPDPFKHVFPE